jgi:PRTRC genetic system protein A
MQPQNLITPKIVSSLPTPPHTSTLYEYLFAGNGVFIRAKREGLSATIPVNLYPYPLRGLPHLQPHIEIAHSPIPKAILLNLWRQSCSARTETKLIEILFHLDFNGDSWQLTTPSQTQSPSRCQTTEAYPQSALVEIHSHGKGCAYFSSTDNQEETGFRLYGVIGRLDSSHPEILLRIGIYGHFMILPASTLFELPDFFIDVAQRNHVIQTYYSTSNPL